MSSTSLLGIIERRKNFEEKEILNDINKIFRAKGKSVFHIPPPGKSVILLTSGGLDSIGLWLLLMAKYGLNVYPIYCYPEGLESPNQTKSISFFTHLFNKRFPKLFRQPETVVLPRGFSFRENAIEVKNSLSLLIPNLYQTKDGGIRAAVINNPTRIFDYISQAISLALKLKYEKKVMVTTIITGFIPEDGIATREPTLSVLRSINLTLSLIMGDFNYQIMAPIDKESGFYYKKSSLIRHAIEHKVPIEKTWSCLEKGKRHCGVCTSCRMRKEAFKLSGKKDLTIYRLTLAKIAPFLRKIANRTKIKLRPLSNIFQQNRKIIITDDSRFYINPLIEWDVLDGGIVYRMNRQTGLLDCLNDTGSLIWLHIKKNPRISLSELVFHMDREYPHMRRSKLSKDVALFLSEAVMEKYLICVPPNK